MAVWSDLRCSFAPEGLRDVLLTLWIHRGFPACGARTQNIRTCPVSRGSPLHSDIRRPSFRRIARQRVSARLRIWAVAATFRDHPTDPMPNPMTRRGQPNLSSLTASPTRKAETRDRSHPSERSVLVRIVCLQVVRTPNPRLCPPQSNADRIPRHASQQILSCDRLPSHHP